jgi:MFS family permease
MSSVNSTAAETTPAVLPYATPQREISPAQWKAGGAAVLGWLFDGLDMHLYTLVAAPLVMKLMHASSKTDPAVIARSSWVGAAMLLGWALGGGLFGRLGDKFGRSRALSFTILTYAGFTGLTYFANTWWQLLLFRFLSGLGIGGEWAVGSSLLAESWPARLRPWAAAVLQTGVNVGVLIACGTVYILAGVNNYEHLVFLVGALPALIVFWIRRSVPEPEVWRNAQARSKEHEVTPRVSDLFRGEVRRTTVLTIIVCACSLTAWWAFMLWNQQHVRNLPDLQSWNAARRERLVSSSFFLVIGISIIGNFFAALLAKLMGYREAISVMFVGFFFAMAGAYWVPRDHVSLLMWLPWIGFFSGVFGLFTMYLPPLFPTLLRTTGAGFSYNIGRIAAAAGTIFFGLFHRVGDFRLALLLGSFLFLPAAAVAMMLPKVSTTDPAVVAADVPVVTKP